MNRYARWILFAAVAAFIAGSLPVVIEFFCENFYLTEKGITLTKDGLAGCMSFLKTLKEYSWHLLVLYAIAAAVIIFMEGLNPDRTILWLLVLFFVPVFGVIIYTFLGPNWDARYNRNKIPKRFEGYGGSSDIDTDKELLACNLYTCGHTAPTSRNKVKILINGDETFPEIMSAIKEAKSYIHMEFFILRDDELGKEICALLKDAAKKGVDVRFLYDAVGSWTLKKRFVDKMNKAGVKMHSFMPVSFAIFRRRTNFRNHRKIMVVDGKIAFTGGLNIGVEYQGKGHLGFWRDTFVKVEGESVAALHEIFIHDWCDRRDEEPEEIRKYLGLPKNLRPKGVGFDKLPPLPIQVAASGTDNGWHVISRGYWNMISHARKRVWITSPYLVPGASLMFALSNAALSGVDVRILMPSSKDHFLVFWGSRSNIEPLLLAGVRIFQYQKGFVHTKSIVADDDIASVGTCNMDVRSLEINFENQLFIYDNGVAEQFAKQFEEDTAEDVCREITLDEWQKRPKLHKLLESFGRLYSAQI